jgi:DNA mismatch repair protein PMS2
LASVRTLGFRGEALNALCAHARVTLLTRTDAASPIAVLTYDERGELQSSATRDSDARLPRAGTVVCVDNLFGATPVRAAVLREQQARQCATLDRLFLHYGLLYPRVDMRFDFTPLAGGGRLVFKGAVASLNDAVSLQFGSKLRDDLDSFAIEHEEFRAQLLVPRAAPSPPTGVMRGTSDHMFLSVNGRPIVCQPLSQVLECSLSAPLSRAATLSVCRVRHSMRAGSGRRQCVARQTTGAFLILGGNDHKIDR